MVASGSSLHLHCVPAPGVAIARASVRTTGSETTGCETPETKARPRTDGFYTKGCQGFDLVIGRGSATFFGRAQDRFEMVDSAIMPMQMRHDLKRKEPERRPPVSWLEEEICEVIELRRHAINKRGFR